MDQTRRLIDDRAVSPSTYQHVIAWSEEHRTSIAKIASGAAPGFSIADANLAKAWLLCADGHFSTAEAHVIALFASHIETIKTDREVFFSFLYSFFLLQRLDVVASMLKEKFGFSRPLQLTFHPGGIGAGCIRWDISPSPAQHSFNFDAVCLRRDDTRTHILQFMWAFPLFSRYSAREDQETGSVYLNQEDIGSRPGLAYCDSRPDYFLIPDYIFVPSEGYRYARQVLSENRRPWSDRLPKAFWRGATTGVPSIPDDWRSLDRIKLCEWALRPENKARIDAGFSSIVQIPDQAVISWLQQTGMVTGGVPWQDWGNHKYLIDIDGNSSPWSNLFQRLLTGSVVLKIESRRGLQQWYYDRLEPWKNYIPVASDLSDLGDKIEWLRRHDDFARQVGERGLATANALTYESELERSGKVINSAFRYFNGNNPSHCPPFGRPTVIEKPPGRVIPPP